ncbi:universal stress protein [Streptosporangium amethystogenes]|uniref:universal stress protein n=1 Tax=Streptosporangium amethystogenes TaxID=2002 RepID=UPI0037BD0CC0
MFHRIVIAYDGSEGTLAVVLDMARKFPSRGHRGGRRGPLPHYGSTVGEVNEERRIEQQLCDRWLSSARARANAQGVGICTEIRTGHPAQELVRVADANQADLIAVEHSGHSQIWGRFIDSTAEKVSRHAHRSVLIVR